jgi:Zn-dependent protease
MFGGPSFKLFRLLGFRIGAHWTLPIALAVAGFSFGGVWGVLLAATLFASILAHELGHAVIARRLGVPIAGIDLHMFGGVAKMAAPPRSPNDEIAIAIAGPIVSLALAGALLGAHALAGGGVLLWLGSANLMLALFNLVPALPLDGGRVFRALLAKRRGLYRGTLTAVRVARVFALLLGVSGLFSGQLMLVFLAVLIWMMGSAELRNVEQHEVLVRMGAWHPADVPWVRYDVAADRERAPFVRGRQRARMVLEPDVIYER